VACFSRVNKAKAGRGMPIYYFSVRYLPDNADVRLLSGRCITALHYYLINNEPYNVGASFPLWTDETMGDE
jgi:CRISPR-associated endonuclease Csy4